MRLKSPSPYQEAIFSFIEEGRGHGVVRATAGSGKTTTLIEAAHRLSPELKACFLAFNVHAASELKRRLPKHVQGRTVHSLAYAILARYLGPGRKPNVDSTKYSKLADTLLRRDPRTRRLPPMELRSAASYLKNLATYIQLELAPAEGIPELVGRYRLRCEQPALLEVLHELVWTLLDSGYEQAKEGLADFTDMLFVPVMEKLAPPTPFDLVFVDEAQDLSRLQLAFVLGCVAKGGRLVFVGDPRQAIYGFSGADTRALERIVELTKATVLPLSVSYRCPASHVRLANQFAPEMEAAPGAVDGSIKTITELALSTHASPGDLVLCRTNAPLIRAALHLIQEDIPARIEGRDLAGKLVKDAGAAFGASLTGWEKRLGPYRERELSKVLNSRLPADARGRLLALREDELECLEAVVRAATRGGVGDVAGLSRRIDALFRDRLNSVTFSSVHKAKGKEAQRVFILYPHLMPLGYEGKEAQLGEACVQFVAVTRSLSELVFVEAVNGPVGPAWWRRAETRAEPEVALAQAG